MSNFLNKKIENFKKNKEKYYKELGYEINQDFIFFKPYQSFSDFGQELGSLPIKFWTCLLQAILDFFYVLVFLTFFSLTMLLPCPVESPDYLSQSLLSLSSTLYFMASAVMDTLATSVSLIIRTGITLFSLFVDGNAIELQNRPENSQSRAQALAI